MDLSQPQQPPSEVDLLSDPAVWNGSSVVQSIERYCQKVESKTKWDGNKIVSRSATRGFGDRFDGFKTVTWQISKDGNTIKQMTMIRSTISTLDLIREPRKTTHTFVRVP